MKTKAAAICTIASILVAAAAIMPAAAADLEPYATIRLKSFDSIAEIGASLGALTEQPTVGMVVAMGAMGLKQGLGASFNSARPIAAAISSSEPLPANLENCEDFETVFEKIGESLVVAAALPATEKQAKNFFAKKGAADWTDGVVEMESDFFATFKKGHLILSNHEDGAGALADKLLDSIAPAIPGAQIEIAFHAPAVEFYKKFATSTGKNMRALTDPLGTFPQVSKIYESHVKKSCELSTGILDQIESYAFAFSVSQEAGISFDDALALKSGELLAALAKTPPLDPAKLAFIPDTAKAFAAASDLAAACSYSYEIVDNLFGELAALIPDADLKADVMTLLKQSIAVSKTITATTAFADTDSNGRLVVASKDHTSDPAACADYLTHAFALWETVSEKYLDGAPWLTVNPKLPLWTLDFQELFDFANKKADEPIDKEIEEAAIKIIDAFFGKKFTGISIIMEKDVLTSRFMAEGSDYKFEQNGTAANDKLAAFLAADKDAKPLVFAGVSLSAICADAYNKVPFPKAPDMPKELELASGAPAPALIAVWMDKAMVRSRFNIPAAEIRNLAAFAAELSDDDEDYDDDDDDDDDDDE